ncbi:MAG: EF-hand domain-containing protein [Burkholderiaceae bacterium]
MKRRTNHAAPVPFDSRSLLLFAAITMGASSATVWAQSAAAPADRDASVVALFAQADKNGDKSLSSEEAKAIPALAENFSAVDTNGDGKISQAEFVASLAPAKS